MAKKQDRTEERIVAVEEALSKTEQFIEQNQKVLIILIAAIALIILGFFGFKRLYVKPMEDEARSQMFMAERYFEMDSVNLALYGDGNYPGFLDIIDDYGITQSADLAHYYTGIIYLGMGQYEDAIDHLEDFDGGDQIVGPLAEAAIGDAYMELDKPEKAVKYYIDAAEMSDNEFTTPAFYQKAGWTYEILGEYDKAVKIYETIKHDYPTSMEAREIDKYIARAKKMAGK